MFVRLPGRSKESLFWDVDQPPAALQLLAVEWVSHRFGNSMFSVCYPERVGPCFISSTSALRKLRPSTGGSLWSGCWDRQTGHKPCWDRPDLFRFVVSQVFVFILNHEQNRNGTQQIQKKKQEIGGLQCWTTGNQSSTSGFLHHSIVDIQVTRQNPRPVELQMDKVYWPLGSFLVGQNTSFLVKVGRLRNCHPKHYTWSDHGLKLAFGGKDLIWRPLKRFEDPQRCQRWKAMLFHDFCHASQPDSTGKWTIAVFGWFAGHRLPRFPRVWFRTGKAGVFALCAGTFGRSAFSEC